jgi:hypothetical protein
MRSITHPASKWLLVMIITICPRDLNGDGKVNFEDFAIMASHWLNTNCADNNNCNGTDLNLSGTVDCNDSMIFCQHWPEGVTQ